jgi:hypothetical protein
LVQGWVNGSIANDGMELVKSPESGSNPVLLFYTSALSVYAS